MTDKPDWLRRATERAVRSRDFTKTTTEPYDDDAPFDGRLEQQEQLPDDTLPSQSPDEQD
ncbi:hypothetical protein [Trinickia mobilis]|uniref:hypothetical protein n=1 Tax=Trinickia mobilis TaxID=2816356 RepID=UPI001A8CE73F|nr:hypothetical protein [Trinickia mobilis]